MAAPLYYPYSENYTTWLNEDADITTLNDGSFVVVFSSIDSSLTSSKHVFMQSFSSQGVSTSGRIIVSSAVGGNHVDPCVTALATGGYVVAWTRINGVGDNDLYMETFDTIYGSNQMLWELNPTGSNSTRSIQELGALSDGGWMVAYLSDQETAGGESYLYVVRFDAFGREIHRTQMLSAESGGQRDASMAELSNGNVVVSWTEETAGQINSISFQVITADGSVLVATKTLASVNGSDVDRLSEVVPLDDGGFMVVWKSATGIRAKIYDASGQLGAGNTIVLSDSLVDTMTDITTTVLANGDRIIMWNNAGSNQNVDFEAVRITSDGTLIGQQYDVFPAGINAGRISGRFAIAGLEEGGFAIIANDRYHRGPSIVIVEQGTASDDVEFLARGGAFDELATGAIYDAGQGNDFVIGTAFDDWIIGGSGGDTIKGGDGDDYIYLDDPLNPNGNSAYEDVAYGGDGRDVLIDRAGESHLWGGADNDLLRGGSDNDQLHGGGQNDVLHGGAGSDILRGGSGRDILRGGDDDDDLDGGGGNDILRGGDGNDVIRGGGGRDRIRGGEGDDTIMAGASNDRIIGGNGDDLMYGGDAADTFIFYFNDNYYQPDEKDTIADFEIGIDKISLVGFTTFLEFADLDISMEAENAIIDFGYLEIVVMGIGDTLSEVDFIF